MGLFRKYVNQTRKPEGFLGKLMISGMNSGHAKNADWGMSYLQKENPAKIADLGCGGGRNAAELLRRYRNAKETAVDYSSLCVEKASAVNEKAILAGRCEVIQGDVSHLELNENTYDLVTAFETIYFWPDLQKCFEEVYRITKQGGLFMVVNESDGKDAASLKFETIIEGMKNHTADEIADTMKKAGFTDIMQFHHPSKPWITVTGRKK